LKYCILIMDGAAGLPLPALGGKTSLEIALTPNLDELAKTGITGLVRTVPPGFEPDSAVACMSLFGYDPRVYYGGRAPIEAKSLGIDIAPGDVLFRCNLVTVQNGTMVSHSAGYISTEEAHELVASLNTTLGDERIHFYPGVSYRNILKIKKARGEDQAICTPPHDIPGKHIDGYLPRGAGSILLSELMTRSEAVLKAHPVNQKRLARGQLPATSIWLFWGSGSAPVMPSFQESYGLRATVSSGVDLLRGLGMMCSMDILRTPGVTDGLDNDYDAQAQGALAALKLYDIVILHIEAPDEAAHAGSVKDKVEAIQRIDKAVVGHLMAWHGDKVRLLVAPDHPTPISARTHTTEPVPFVMWGPGLVTNGAKRLTEVAAGRTGLLVDPGYTLMQRLIGE
jgi:2,3-bisphosphoglycerate-independent phosphoglycerate mutase